MNFTDPVLPLLSGHLDGRLFDLGGQWGERLSFYGALPSPLMLSVLLTAASDGARPLIVRRPRRR